MNLIGSWRIGVFGKSEQLQLPYRWLRESVVGPAENKDVGLGLKKIWKRPVLIRGILLYSSHSKVMHTQSRVAIFQNYQITIFFGVKFPLYGNDQISKFKTKIALKIVFMHPASWNFVRMCLNEC